MRTDDPANPYAPPSGSASAGPRRPLVHVLTIGSVLCSAAGLPWAIAVTAAGDDTLRALQLIFIGVGFFGVCAGSVSVYKKYAFYFFDRLLACCSAAVSLVVLTIAILVPWLDTIDRYVHWSRL